MQHLLWYLDGRLLLGKQPDDPWLSRLGAQKSSSVFPPPQLDRTEVIKSNLHPVFAKVFSLDYYFEEVQKLRFEVYDIHGTHSIGTRDDDFLGGVECTLGQVDTSLPVTTVGLRAETLGSIPLCLRLSLFPSVGDECVSAPLMTPRTLLFPARS